MVKLVLSSLISAVLLLQLASPTAARALSEVINIDIRNNLKAYEIFLAQDDGTYKDDLTKLIKLSEGALVIENPEEKKAILMGLDKEFSDEFNKYMYKKLDEFKVNNNINRAIGYFRNIAGDATHKTEIEATIAKLQAILEMTNLKEKVTQFLEFGAAFTPEFQKFLHENDLSAINHKLQTIEEFLEALLREPEEKYKIEIKALIAQIKAVLGDVSLQEKQSTFQKVTNPELKELYDYLGKKFKKFNQRLSLKL